MNLEDVKWSKQMLKILPCCCFWLTSWFAVEESWTEVRYETKYRVMRLAQACNHTNRVPYYEGGRRVKGGAWVPIIWRKLKGSSGKEHHYIIGGSMIWGAWFERILWFYFVWKYAKSFPFPDLLNSIRAGIYKSDSETVFYFKNVNMFNIKFWWSAPFF